MKIKISEEERKRRKNAARNLKYATDAGYAKRESEKSARYRLDNPEKVKACKADHYVKNKAEVDAKNRARYNANPEPYKAYSIAYAREHKQEVAAYSKKYQAENADIIKVKKAASYLKNRDDFRVKWLAYYAKNADKIKAKSREWSKANPVKRNATESAWRRANPDKVREIRERYNTAHPGVQRLGRLNRRARERLTPGKLSLGIAPKLMTLQKGKCPVCRVDLTKTEYHLDHIEPLARGGAHDDLNMQLLCKSCNLSKHAKHPIDFMQSRGFLL